MPVLPSRYLKVRERRRRNQQRKRKGREKPEEQNTRDRHKKGKRQREIQGTFGYFVTSVLCPGAALAFADHLNFFARKCRPGGKPHLFPPLPRRDQDGAPLGPPPIGHASAHWSVLWLFDVEIAGVFVKSKLLKMQTKGLILEDVSGQQRLFQQDTAKIIHDVTYHCAGTPS